MTKLSITPIIPNQDNFGCVELEIKNQDTNKSQKIILSQSTIYSMIAHLHDVSPCKDRSLMVYETKHFPEHLSVSSITPNV